MPNVIETADATASTTTTYTLGIGQTAQGDLVGADHDWYRVQLVAGQQYTFAMTGSGVTGVRTGDPLLTLRTSSGVAITNDDDSGPGRYSSITFTAPSSGTFYLDVGSFNDASPGQYGLSAITGNKATFDEMMAAATLDILGLSWSTPGTAAVVTWGVRDTFANSTDAQNNPAPFFQLSAAQIAAVQTGLSQYSEVANITFNQVNPGGTTNNATMLFSAYTATNDGAGAYAVFPAIVAADNASGDVRLNNNSVSTTSLPAGSYSYVALIHEIGHAVGLSHPGDYNAAPGVAITYAANAQFIQDSNQYTIMSYFDEAETTTSFNSEPDTLLLFDIFALHQLYGANTTTRTGSTTYGFNSNAGALYDFAINTDPFLCIWDAGGIDKIDASGFGMAQTIDLRAGSFSNIGGFVGNVSIAFGAVIEQATGGNGADILTGNGVSNLMVGGGGGDTLDGLTGADTMRGGAGGDLYRVDNTGDIVDESVAGSNGVDSVQSTISFSLVNSATVLGALENVSLLGSSNINATGNALANTLWGNSGVNILDGLTGADTMRGRGGSDLYRVDNIADIVDEADGGGGGIDTVQSTISFSLTNNPRVLGVVENVSLLAGGPSIHTNATGNTLANTLWGNGGNNILDGLTGADTMRGRGGNDTYRVENAGDIVDEADGGGGGIDTVQSMITFSLVNSARVLGAVENLSLTGAGAINATGNALANTIWAGTGNNILTGNGGADTFVFHTALNATTNVDTITDFAVDDTIQLENAVFTALVTLGTLAAGAFVIAASAQDGDDRIVYNSATGALSYDFNGNLAGGGVKFAQLSAGLALTNADFFVI